MSEEAGGGVGVYVHIPFCAHRCDYCAFAAWDDRGGLLDAYLDALLTDIARTVAAGLPPVTTVFVGGGTPSLLDAPALAEVLAAIPVAGGAEVTVECNPDTVDAAKLAAYVDAGVTRLSFGVQSMVPHVLGALGRTHSIHNVTRAVDEARAVGIDDLNVDLIYGAAGETVDDWARTLDEVAALEPPHISAYALTVEAGTPLAADRARHPDDDDQAAKYELADERFAAMGLRWYEISNWARPGHECRHNQRYWSMGEYVGFGCAAHSHRGGTRWWNVRTPERYIGQVRAGESATAGSEVLDAAGRHLEASQLALRTRAGVPSGALDAGVAAELSSLVSHDADADRWVLTRQGRLLANEVALRLG